MRTKATRCRICKSKGKLHGQICNSCDYKRRKKYFKKRAEHRKKVGYYVGRPQSHDYVKARKYYPLKCSDCGYCDETRILQVHHKDRNRKNHDIKNLIILCPNCHELRHYKTQTGRYHKNPRIKN